MDDANSLIFEVQNTPVLEFNGATVENLAIKTASFPVDGISISIIAPFHNPINYIFMCSSFLFFFQIFPTKIAI
jgi:hypothetical protein